MEVLFDFDAKNKEDALRYAYAFMSSKQLYVKECAFFNPHATQFDNIHVFPTDMYSAVYNEKSLPSWEEFKISIKHLSSPAYDCTASINAQDTKRIKCIAIEGKIAFISYGNYGAEAKKICEDVLEIYKTLS